MTIKAQDLLSSLDEAELVSMVDSNTSCKGLLTGYIAEYILMKQLREIPEISEVSKIPDQGSKKEMEGDISIIYKGRLYTIEVRCLRSNSKRETLLEPGFSGKVFLGSSHPIKIEGGGKVYSFEKGRFDILAICTVTITGEWDYYLTWSKYLPSSPTHPDRIKSTISVNIKETPCLHSDIIKVLEDIA